MSLLNPSPEDAQRPWITPGEPGAVRQLCPFDCGWFYDEPRRAMGTMMQRVMETEAAIREHLSEHTAAVMLSKESEQ